MMIFLCGFSGAGKTYLLKKLQQDFTDFNWFFFDLDEEIEKRKQSPIWKIVQECGIDHFRTLETEQLEKIQGGKDLPNCLVALGGGALDLNLKSIKNTPDTKLVWLDTPFEKCFARISGDECRPLASLGRNKLEKLYCQRCTSYQKADLVLSNIQIENVKKLNQLIDLLK